MKEQESKMKRIEKQTDTYKEQSGTGHFTGNFTMDLASVKEEIRYNSDVHFREFNIGCTDVRAALVFVEGLSDKDLIDMHILKSLMLNFYEEYKGTSFYMEGIISKEFIKNRVLSISGIEEVHSIKELMSKVLLGSTALLIDGLSDVFILNTRKGKPRNIEEPISEVSVRGPRVGFTEVLCDNTALLRLHGENDGLSLTKLQVGKRD
ncbi:hypothetical protein AZF08_07455 [Bacillus gaemokensis]|nr:hypothetical protein AZF08_07455 [Bacillus gaemokensis]